jgi:hypothetical protein
VGAQRRGRSDANAPRDRLATGNVPVSALYAASSVSPDAFDAAKTSATGPVSALLATTTVCSCGCVAKRPASGPVSAMSDANHAVSRTHVASSLCRRPVSRFAETLTLRIAQPRSPRGGKAPGRRLLFSSGCATDVFHRAAGSDPDRWLSRSVSQTSAVRLPKDAGHEDASRSGPWRWRRWWAVRWAAHDTMVHAAAMGRGVSMASSSSSSSPSTAAAIGSDG